MPGNKNKNEGRTQFKPKEHFSSFFKFNPNDWTGWNGGLGRVLDEKTLLIFSMPHIFRFFNPTFAHIWYVIPPCCPEMNGGDLSKAIAHPSVLPVNFIDILLNELLSFHYALLWIQYLICTYIWIEWFTFLPPSALLGETTKDLLRPELQRTTQFHVEFSPRILRYSLLLEVTETNPQNRRTEVVTDWLRHLIYQSENLKLIMPYLEWLPSPWDICEGFRPGWNRMPPIKEVRNSNSYSARSFLTEEDNFAVCSASSLHRKSLNR